jgi:DNA-binding NarL/FixJ family response regulator
MLAITQDNSSRRHVSLSRLAQPPVKKGCHMKILVIDDHFLIRAAFRDLVRQLNEDAIVIEAENIRQAMQLILDQPDLDFVLLDLNLPDGDGLSALRELHEHRPALPVVVLSDERDRKTAIEAFNLGARGVMSKSGQQPILLGALRLIFSGGVYIPQEFLVRDQPPARRIELDLSDRQLDVLNLMMQGKTNKAICRTLNLAVPTVKNHVTAILKALKVTNRTEAVIVAQNFGTTLRLSDRAV